MRPALTLLEFICNLRWLLLYCVQRLDPVIESHYAPVMDLARRAESTLARSFAGVHSIADVPVIALRAARDGIVYLLVAEAVLGHCPPTMHSFLLHATANGSGETIDNSDRSSVSQLDATDDKVHQSHFLLVRWLVAEGLLTDEELMDSISATNAGGTGTLGRFELHVSMAKELASAEPFALGGHVVLTRALLLHHCCTVLNVKDVISHVEFINPGFEATLDGMEDGLLLWLRSVIDALRREERCDDSMHCAALSALGNSLYTSQKSGIVPALVLQYYHPNLFPSAAVSIETEMKESRQRNWGLVLRAAEELSLVPALYADEAEESGAMVLQLHLLRFAEELFAVLATHAEITQEEYLHSQDTQHQGVREVQHRRVRTPEHQEPDASESKEKNTNTIVNSSHFSSSSSSSNSSSGNVAYRRGDDLPERDSLSAHNRRQYDVMKASLHYRSGGTIEVPMSACSPTPSKLVSEPVAPPFSRPASAVVASTRTTITVGKKKTPAVVVVASRRSVTHTGQGSSNFSSANVADKSQERKEEKGEGGGGGGDTTRGFTMAKTGVLPMPISESLPSFPSQSASNQCVRDTERRAPRATVVPTASLATSLEPMPAGCVVRASCTTSESSFLVNTVRRPDDSSEGIRPPPPLPPQLTCVPGSLRDAAAELESTDLSPLTPDIMTYHSSPTGTSHRHGSVMGTAFVPKQQVRFPTNTSTSMSIRGSGGGSDSSSNATSFHAPHTAAAQEDREVLLQTLQQQQVLIHRLARKLADVKGTTEHWRHSDISEMDSMHTVNTVQQLLRSEVNRRTEMSSQRAETDVSSVCEMEYIFDGTESFLDC